MRDDPNAGPGRFDLDRRRGRHDAKPDTPLRDEARYLAGRAKAWAHYLVVSVLFLFAGTVAMFALRPLLVPADHPEQFGWLLFLWALVAIGVLRVYGRKF